MGAKNLGMSTLVRENGKTQEEMDVENIVRPKMGISAAAYQGPRVNSTAM